MRNLLLCLAMLGFGCGQPRSRDEIFAERRSLPEVYLGIKTQKRVIAPASKGVFVDPETKDEFWPALECTNLDCPNRQGNEPSLFVLARSEHRRDCPHCLKNRNLKNESPEQKAKYDSFVAPYVLPETKARIKQLDDEFKRSTEYEARYRRK